MKKCLLFLLALLALEIGHAQNDSLSALAPIPKVKSPSKFYLKIYGGYGLLSPGSYRIQSSNVVSYKDANNNWHDTSIQTEGKHGIGGGGRFGGGLGYIVNDFWSLGIDFEFQKSRKLDNTLGTALGQYDYDSTSDEMHYRAMTLTPYITFKAVSKPNYYLYNKLGIVFTMPFTLYSSGRSKSSRSNVWPAGPADSAVASLAAYQNSHDDKYEMSLGIGFGVAFGINLRLGGNWRLFAEAFGNFSALKPSTSTLNKVTGLRYSAFSPGDYDYSVNPPVALYYNPSGYESIYHELNHVKYIEGGETSNRQESYVWNPGDPNTYVTNSSIDKRFQANMNVIGFNCGIMYRLW